MKTVMISHPDHASDYLLTNYRPLWWQVQGLTKTRTGYGIKIPTSYTVKYQGRERRIYCDTYSNTGHTYIIIKGEKVAVY